MAIPKEQLTNLKNLLRNYVKGELNEAFNQFEANPSSVRWLRLEQLMGAWQGLNPGGTLTEAEIEQCLEQVPMVQWIGWLHTKIKGTA